jgi:hypothetical protein
MNRTRGIVPNEFKTFLEKASAFASTRPMFHVQTIILRFVTQRRLGLPGLSWRYQTHRHSPAVAPSDAVLELRPLRSTGITRLRHYYEPLRLLAPPRLSLTGCGSKVALLHGARPLVLLEFPLARAAVYHSGRIVKRCRSLRFDEGGLPLRGRGSAPASPVFGARSTFTPVAARAFAESPSDPFTPKAFYGPVASSTTLAASGWNDQLPGGCRPHGKLKPFHDARRGRGDTCAPVPIDPALVSPQRGLRLNRTCSPQLTLRATDVPPAAAGFNSRSFEE